MWNPAADLASFPELLDDGGTAGLYGVGRLPEVAYTLPVPPAYIVRSRYGSITSARRWS